MNRPGIHAGKTGWYFKYDIGMNADAIHEPKRQGSH